VLPLTIQGRANWEAGSVMTDPVSGDVSTNQYGRPKLTNENQRSTTMSDLTDRFASIRDLPRHLRELALLVGRSVDRHELLPLHETKAIRAQASQVDRQPVVQFEVPFEAKTQPRFATFVKRIAEANPSDVFLWTPTSNLCGLLRPLPLAAVHMDFPFHLNPEGIVSILTSDLREQLLLDYSTGNDDESVLQVQVSGERWGRVAY
jgi:hypothetical protein